MSKLKTILAAAAFAISIGCHDVASLHGLAAEGDPRVVFEPALLGKWNSERGAIAEITRTGKSSYSVTLGEDQPVEWTVLLLRVRDSLVTDTIRVLDDDRDDRVGLWQVHFFGKVRVQGDDLWYAGMGSQWLDERTAHRGHPRREVIANDTLFTASPAELWKTLLLPYVDEPRAWDDDPIHFGRVK